MGRLFTEQFAFSKGDSVLVIGLGRFGRAVAESLMNLGHDVMGIDSNADLVQSAADRLTHAVQADSTNVMTLRQLGCADFAHAIVAIGSNLSASLMTLMSVTELEIQDIWVKAMNPEHGAIAERIGAHHVVYPEADMGERVAHLVSGRMIDYMGFDDGFAIARLQAPASTQGKTLEQSRVRERFGVTVVGVKRHNRDFEHATPTTMIQPGDLLVVSGPTAKLEKFAGIAG